jgi:hypothetical protein
MVLLEVQVWEGDGVEPEGMKKSRLEREAAEAISKFLSNTFPIGTNPQWPAPSPFVLCECCGKLKPGDVQRRRRNTQYVDEASNLMVCCHECFSRDEEMMKEQWAEYYAGRL